MEINGVSPSEMIEINAHIANAGSNPPPEVVTNPFTRFIEGTTNYVAEVLDFGLNPISFVLGKTGGILGSTLEGAVKPVSRFVESLEPLTDSLAQSAESLRLPLVLASIVLTAKGNPTLGVKLAKLATSDSFFRYDSKTEDIKEKIEKGKDFLSGDASVADLWLNLENHGMLKEARKAIADARKMHSKLGDQTPAIKEETPAAQPFTYRTSPIMAGRRRRGRAKGK